MATRCIEHNPDRVRLVRRPEGWRWSNARAHHEGIDGGLTRRGALAALVPDWRAYLDDTPPCRQADRLRRHVRTGWRLGHEKLLAVAEKAIGRKVGRKGTRAGERAATERNG